MNIVVNPTVMPAFHTNIARSTGNLQVVANKAYLYDSAGVKIEGTDVALGETEGDKGLNLSYSEDSLRVSYLNSVSNIAPMGLRILYNDSSTFVDDVLIDFSFVTAPTLPAWGLWSFDFKVTFTA